MMNLHHKSALLKARRQFRKARNHMLLVKDAYECERERVLHCLWQGMYPRRELLLHYIGMYHKALEAYTDAGDLLGTVERLLEKA